MSDPKILKKMEQENQKYKPKPAVVAVYWILRLIVIGVMVMTIIHKNLNNHGFQKQIQADAQQGCPKPAPV